MEKQHGIMAERLVLGAVAGIIGTWAMTLSMKVMFRKLPNRERYPLPPREITETVLPSSVRRASTDRAMAAQTLAAHFGYGAVCGGLFTLSGLHETHPLPRGMAWGVGVWSASYFGLMPIFGILAPATRHPTRRNALMIAAHLVWGAGLGIAAKTLRASMDPFSNRDDRGLLDTQG